ncbi:lipopolysaccharide biosynthesis protein [Sulfurimonas sp. HSL3-7]|uniref:lipopolysaccharide biosynthesis protein n=1 Tax=Sulfonitrofixus jiaomeiensis TaxID=3131938 RepID=UPI0031F8BE45
MDNLKSKGATAFLWDFFGKMAMHGTAFVVMIFLARLLEPSAFGLVAMVMVIVTVAKVFTDVGLGGALIQRRRVLPIHYTSVFYFNIFVGACLTIITYSSATLVSEFYKNEQLIPIVQVMSIMFFFTAFSSVHTNILRKELKYAALTKVNFASALLSGIAGVALAFYGAGVWSLVAQALSRVVFYNLFIWFASQWTPSLLFSFKALRQLWGYGFRIFLSGLLETIFTRLDIIIIGKLFTPAALGFFQQAKALDGLIVTYSSSSIMAVLFPILSKVQNDLPRFQHIAIRTLEVICFILFLLLGGMYLISEELIVMLFTEKWLPTAAYFKILVLSGFAYPISALLVNILKGKGNSKAFLRLEIYKKILISINFYVGFLWGIEGYLYGLVVVSVLSVILNTLFASREIHLSVLQFIKPMIVQMLLSVSTVILVVYITSDLELNNILLIVIKGLLFTFLYFFTSAVFRTAPFMTFRNQALQVIRRKISI